MKKNKFFYDCEDIMNILKVKESKDSYNTRHSKQNS